METNEVHKMIENIKEEDPETCINIIFVLFQYKVQQEE
jgi:hypothetical protein